jgi:hypothetical protein
VELRTCGRCKISKPIDLFPLTIKRGAKLYRQSYCPDCRREARKTWGDEHRVELTTQMRERYRADPEKYRARARARRRANGAKPRQEAQYKREKTYGVTKEQYEAMLAAQDGVCAICHQIRGKRQLGVDHNHATGEVRGLLCGPCNMGLGAYHDDVELLRAAISYLER